MSTFFFDTSVLLSAFDASDAQRQRLARLAIDEAIQSGRFVTSSQVMHEFYKIAMGSLLLSTTRAESVLRHLAMHRVMGLDADTVLRAARLQQRTQLNLSDALVVQSALDAGCRVLYSEALPAGLQFDGPASLLSTVNPMAMGNTLNEPRAAYTVISLRRPAPGVPSCEAMTTLSTAPASAPGA